VVLPGAALVEVTVTGVYICGCEHPKSQHKREQHGCRALDCGCGGFEADLKASAAAQGVALAAGALAAAGPAAVTGLGPTSAQLRRAEAERDELARRVAQLEQENERREETVARNVQERDRALDACDELRKQRDLARDELKHKRETAEIRARVVREQHDELVLLRALVARVEQAAGIDPESDRGVDLADRVQSIRDGRTEAVDALAQIANDRNVLAEKVQHLCETCGSRYSQPHTDHEHGRLTPVLVTTTRITRGEQ
jgi:DNA repair exonuclease SbcCD ATPase subunit